METLSRKEIVGSLRKDRLPLVYEPLYLASVQALTPEIITLDQNDYLINDHAFSQTLKALSIPKSFYMGLDQNVKKKVLAHQRGLKAEEVFKFRVINQERVDACVPYEYNETPAMDLVPLLPDIPYVESDAKFGSPIMHIRGIFKEFEVAEKVFLGFDFAYSEVGGVDMTIQALVWVQVCTNGAIRSRQTGPYFKVPMTLFDGIELQAVGGLLSDRLTQDNEKIQGQIAQSMTKSVDVTRMLDYWLQAKEVPRSIPKKVSARMETEETGDSMSVWDLSMLVSNIGRHLGNYRTRVRFEQIAGQLLQIPISVPAIE